VDITDTNNLIWEDGMKDSINTEMNRLLDNAITESLAGIKVKPETGEVRAKLRSEIISTREAIARHPAFKQMVDIAIEWFVAQVQPERERLQIAEQKHKAEIAKALKHVDGFEADYELKKAEFAAADPATRRMQVWADAIDRVLPLPEGHKNGYTFDQAIRSRGLVMAALAGMTSVGTPIVKEETK
jgi:hypothetical protein